MFLALRTFFVSWCVLRLLCFIDDGNDGGTGDRCRLTLSRQRPISYRNQSIDLQSESMDWFLYDIDLRHERVKWFLKWFLLDSLFNGEVKALFEVAELSALSFCCFLSLCVD